MSRLGLKRCTHTLCRENQFLLEERDLLSQQLAAENLRESATTPLQGNRGGVPARVLSPIPYFTPATPSATGLAGRQRSPHACTGCQQPVLELPTRRP